MLQNPSRPKRREGGGGGVEPCHQDFSGSKGQKTQHRLLWHRQDNLWTHATEIPGVALALGLAASRGSNNVSGLLPTSWSCSLPWWLHSQAGFSASGKMATSRCRLTSSWFQYQQKRKKKRLSVESLSPSPRTVISHWLLLVIRPPLTQYLVPGGGPAQIG